MSYAAVIPLHARRSQPVPVRHQPQRAAQIIRFRPAYGLGQTPTGTPDITQWRSDVALARQAGIPVLALKAIRSNESGGHANAIRFEPRIFNMLTNNAHQAQFPSDTGSSGTGTAPPAAFNQAYRLDPMNAVKATSWGLYQVLIRDAGPHIMAQAGNNPARFIAMFNANPQAVSDQILVSWFLSRAPAQQAAQQYNWVELAHRYNGCAPPCSTYAGRLQQAYTRWAPEWQQVQPILMRQARNIAIGAGVVAVTSLGLAAWFISRRRPRQAVAAAA